MRLKQHRRKKVQRAYLERRLYKTEKHIDKLNAHAVMLRKTIELMDKQEADRKAKIQADVNKTLQDAAVKSMPVEEKKNASGN